MVAHSVNTFERSFEGTSCHAGALDARSRCGDAMNADCVLAAAHDAGRTGGRFPFDADPRAGTAARAREADAVSAKGVVRRTLGDDAAADFTYAVNAESGGAVTEHACAAVVHESGAGHVVIAFDRGRGWICRLSQDWWVHGILLCAI